MLNLSRIQLELDRAKERLRNVEETIQKVEGKFFSNGPVRYSSLKVEVHPDKTRHTFTTDDGKNQRRKIIASSTDSRIQRLSSDDLSFSLKRSLREKREPGIGVKRQGSDRPQGVFARLSGISYQQADDEDEDDFPKKPTLPSRVFTTASEAPSRQEVIAAQAVDEQCKQRNKRMFGALVGTLQKFRKEETRVREREEKRMKVEKKLEEDAKREKEKLMQEKRELFLEKKRREVEIKRIEWSLNRVKEYEAWEANVIQLKNFIQTQAKPHIFYLPATHNNKTEERLAHSQKIVERMIEKRKTNLKEEIENSEKKARKTAAEGAGEEEAENIPEENEDTSNTEQQMQVDFENKENGYPGEGKKDQTAVSDEIDEKNESGKVEEENWESMQESDTKETGECVDDKLYTEDTAENREGLPVSECKVSDNEPNSISEKLGDDDCSREGHLNKDDEEPNEDEDKDEEKSMCEDEVGNESKVEKETNIALEGSVCESSEAKECSKTVGESKNVENTYEKSPEQQENKEDSPSVKTNDKSLENDSELQSFDKKKSVSESESKTEDNLKENTEALGRKSKINEAPRRRDDSRSRKTSRRSRSPRKRSRSPRFSSRSNRWKSNSHRKRPLRKGSRSDSRSKRSRTPVSKRGHRSATSSKKRSPETKNRRRSSSRSSSSSSPKKRSRSSSSDSSKSD